MPREPRTIHSGCVYHLISRFVDREWFIQTEQERRDYLHLLGRALTSSDWKCLSYAVMSNHIHLAAVAGNDPLHSWIRRVHAPFADMMNRAYDRIGAMFVRGPKARLVADDAVGSVIAYIHNNPVRAGVVDDARGSTWTSHRAYVGLATVPRWLDVREGLARSGFDNAVAFEKWAANPVPARLDEVHDVALCDEMIERHPNERITIDPVALVSATASELGISLAQLRSRRRGAIEVLGREAVALCAQHVGLTGVEIARALGVSQQAVSRATTRGVRTDVIALCQRVLLRVDQAQG
jgi:putative transposase